MSKIESVRRKIKNVNEHDYESACVSNDFIRYSNAFKPLTDDEIDIFLFLCAKAKENYQKDYETKSWYKELDINIVDYYNKTHSKNWNKLPIEARTEFIDKIVSIQDKHFEYKENDIWDYYSYVSHIRYNGKDKSLVATMPSTTKEFLCSFEYGRFTKVWIKYLAKMKSKSTKMLYLYFRSYIENDESKIKGASISIENLKKYMGLSKKYEEWYNFKVRVLVPAIKNINKNTDIFIVGYKEEMEKYLSGRDFNNLSENEQIDVIIKSICCTGSSGKAIQKLKFHVLDKDADIYKRYYSGDKKQENDAFMDIN